MKCFSPSTIFILTLFLLSDSLSIEYKFNTSFLERFTNKINIRPLNVFSSFDLVLDAKCVISPENYHESPNVIFNCGLLENQYLLITFIKKDDKVNIYSNENIIDKVIIKLGENIKLNICINKTINGELAKSCRYVTFWVINDYETSNTNFISYNKEHFDDDHLLNFLDDNKQNQSQHDPNEVYDTANINYIVLEETSDGKTTKSILSPKNGLIIYDIKYGSMVTLHLPQNQHKTTNLLQELHKNTSNPSIIYFIDSKRIGYGPLSINTQLPQLIDTDTAKDTKRTFFLSTLNKNNKERGFVLFVFNFIEDKTIPKDCLEVTVNDSVLKGLTVRDNKFKLPSTVFQCSFNENKTVDTLKIPVDINNSDGMVLYEIKLSDKNNTFLYFNDQLQDSGYYQHQLFLEPGQNEVVDYAVKDNNNSLVLSLRFNFKSALCDRYVYYLSYITKYLSYAAAFINFKPTFELWLFNELTSDLRDSPNEIKIISGNNTLVKKYDFIFTLFNTVTFKLKEEKAIIYSFFASILINILLALILFLLKCIKKHNKSKVTSHNRIVRTIASLSPYGLIVSFTYSLLMLINIKSDIKIKDVFVSSTILKSAATIWIFLSILLYIINNNIGKKVIDNSFTCSPWTYNNQLLKYPELPFYPTIKWQFESIGESNTMKIDVGNSYFLLEYKLTLPEESELENVFYKLTIVSATFNDLNATTSKNQVNEKHLFLLNIPCAWLRTSVPSNEYGDQSNKLFSVINFSDILILYIRKNNKDFYVHYSQTLPDDQNPSMLYIILSIIVWTGSFVINKHNLLALVAGNLLLKLTDLKKSGNKRFLREQFKHNAFLSVLMKILSYGIILGLFLLKFTLSNKNVFKPKTIKQLGVLSSLLMFSSLIPNILIFLIWAKHLLCYFNKTLVNFVNMLFLYTKLKFLNNMNVKPIKHKENESDIQPTSNSQFTNLIENNNSGSSLIINAMFNVAKPLTELNILNFKLLYKNIPLMANGFYVPSFDYKKLMYFYGDLDELELKSKISEVSTLKLCLDDKFSTNTDLNNFFATIEVSRPPAISKLLPDMINSCLSLSIDLPEFLYEDNNKLYDLAYDDVNNSIRIRGPFIVPSGIYTVKAVIKNGYESDLDSDTNFVTSIIADTCRCNYHGILHVPISPDYIDFLSIHNKIHIWKYSKDKTIPFTIYPNVTFVEINKTSNIMILRDQKFIEGSVYKVQYKCLPNKTDIGFTETIIADDNLSRLTVPVPIPKKGFNYKLYEYHVTNSINITYSISPQNELHWGFHDQFVLDIVKSYPKIWGLTNVLDYKIPCIINANVKNDLFRVTPKYNVALSVARAQYEELMAVYSTLLFNRNNSLEFAGFFLYNRDEINRFFNVFTIDLYINNNWINPFSDEIIRIHGHEKMQKAYNALYLDLKYKLEFYINLSEQIIAHLQEMDSLYNQEVLLDAIDAFDKLISSDASIETVTEIVLKKVSRDISPNVLKKSLFPPILQAKNIKWNLHLSSRLDNWKNEIKPFFENQIGFLNSFSMLTSSYRAPLEFSISCLANSLRKLSDEHSLSSQSRERKLTHIVITEKSLVSSNNIWNIQPNCLHTTSFDTLLGYIKINDSEDLSDSWCPTFFYWKPDGILFDIINVDKFYLKFKDITSIEIDEDANDSQNELGIFNGLFSSEEMKTVVISCRPDDPTALNSSILYRKSRDFKIYFKTTESNNKSLGVILRDANAHQEREVEINDIESEIIEIENVEEEEGTTSLKTSSDSDLDQFLYQRFESISEPQKSEADAVILE